MDKTMHFAWAGGQLPPDGAEVVFAWHVRNPDFQIFIWFKPGPGFHAARQTFGAHPSIHVGECDGSVRPGDGSVRMGDGSVRTLIPAVQDGLLLPAVRGELLPAVRGELLPAVMPAGLTMVETGAWGDGSVAPQGILIGLNRGAPNALIGLL